MKKGKRLGYVICNAVAIHNRHFNPILHGGGGGGKIRPPPVFPPPSLHGSRYQAEIF